MISYFIDFQNLDSDKTKTYLHEIELKNSETISRDKEECLRAKPMSECDK